MKLTLTRILKRLAIAGALAIGAYPALAQNFPDKPLTMIIPYGAGGSHDITARLMTSVLPQYLGQPVVVQLMPGASGQTGTTAAAQAAADGYTLVYTHNFADQLLPQVNKLPYEPSKDFVTIARPSSATSAIVVRKDSQFKTLKDLIDYGKANPGELRFGHSGNWGSIMTPGALLLAKEGVKAKFVPYQGGGPVLQGLLAGDVDFSFAFPAVVSSQPELRPLAVLGDEKVLGPDVPTTTELGYPELGPVGLLHRIVLVRSDVPADRIEKLRSAFDELSKDPTYIRLMKQVGEDPATYLKGTDYEPLRAQQAKLYSELVKSGSN
jgi:tripartite-type tricarboxylate transporter receptor subunit TctC